MKLYWPSLFAVLCACGSSDSSDSGGSTGGSGDSTGATATMTATASMSDTLDTMTDSMSDTMTTTMTTDATETTVADSSGSADSGSSGSADSGSSGQGSDSGSTGGAAGVYDQCAQDDPPCADGQMCQLVDQRNFNFCTIPCDTADDCPAPSSGDAVVDCGGPMGQDTRCQLTCSDGETCPDGMECVALGVGNFALCAWPS